MYLLKQFNNRLSAVGRGRRSLLFSAGEPEIVTPTTHARAYPAPTCSRRGKAWFRDVVATVHFSGCSSDPRCRYTRNR